MTEPLTEEELAGIEADLPPADTGGDDDYIIPAGHLRRLLAEARASRRAAPCWVPVAEAPREWEGKRVWWRFDLVPSPSLVTLGAGYSRDPRHCEGIEVCPLVMPPGTRREG